MGMGDKHTFQRGQIQPEFHTGSIEIRTAVDQILSVHKEHTAKSLVQRVLSGILTDFAGTQRIGHTVSGAST
jgi:hypothetical protein